MHDRKIQDYVGSVRVGYKLNNLANASFCLISPSGFFRFKTEDELKDSEQCKKCIEFDIPYKVNFNAGMGHAEKYPDLGPNKSLANSLKKALEEVYNLNAANKLEQKEITNNELQQIQKTYNELKPKSLEQEKLKPKSLEQEKLKKNLLKQEELKQKELTQKELELNEFKQDEALYINLLTPGIYPFERKHHTYLSNQQKLYKNNNIKMIYAPTSATRIAAPLHNWRSLYEIHSELKKHIDMNRNKISVPLGNSTSSFTLNFRTYTREEANKLYGKKWFFKNSARLASGWAFSKLSKNEGVKHLLSPLYLLLMILFATIQLVINLIKIPLTPLLEVLKLLKFKSVKSPVEIYNKPNLIFLAKKSARIVMLAATSALGIFFLNDILWLSVVLFALSAANAASILFKPEGPNNEITKMAQYLKILHPKVVNGCKTARDRTGKDNLEEVLTLIKVMEDKGYLSLAKFDQDLKNKLHETLSQFTYGENVSEPLSKLASDILKGKDFLKPQEVALLKTGKVNNEQRTKKGAFSDLYPEFFRTIDKVDVNEHLEWGIKLNGDALKNLGQAPAFKQSGPLLNVLKYSKPIKMGIILVGLIGLACVALPIVLYANLLQLPQNLIPVEFDPNLLFILCVPGIVFVVFAVLSLRSKASENLKHHEQFTNFAANPGKNLKKANERAEKYDFLNDPNLNKEERELHKEISALLKNEEQLSDLEQKINALNKLPLAKPQKEAIEKDLNRTACFKKEDNEIIELEKFHGQNNKYREDEYKSFYELFTERFAQDMIGGFRPFDMFQQYISITLYPEKLYDKFNVQKPTILKYKNNKSADVYKGYDCIALQDFSFKEKSFLKLLLGTEYSDHIDKSDYIVFTSENINEDPLKIEERNTKMMFVNYIGEDKELLKDLIHQEHISGEHKIIINREVELTDDFVSFARLKNDMEKMVGKKKIAAAQLPEHLYIQFHKTKGKNFKFENKKLQYKNINEQWVTDYSYYAKNKSPKKVMKKKKNIALILMMFIAAISPILFINMPLWGLIISGVVFLTCIYVIYSNNIRKQSSVLLKILGKGSNTELSKTYQKNEKDQVKKISGTILLFLAAALVPILLNEYVTNIELNILMYIFAGIFFLSSLFITMFTYDYIKLNHDEILSSHETQLSQVLYKLSQNPSNWIEHKGEINMAVIDGLEHSRPGLKNIFSGMNDSELKKYMVHIIFDNISGKHNRGSFNDYSKELLKTIYGSDLPIENITKPSDVIPKREASSSSLFDKPAAAATSEEISQKSLVIEASSSSSFTQEQRESEYDSKTSTPRSSSIFSSLSRVTPRQSSNSSFREEDKKSQTTSPTGTPRSSSTFSSGNKDAMGGSRTERKYPIANSSSSASASSRQSSIKP